ncbi:MAG: exopolyphosphatase [Pseudomonadota bacterium]
MSDKKFRLVTRSDFDGLVCAALLKELDMIDAVKFVHPKDMQDGKIEITQDDITTNLPFVPGVGYCFDHHSSELARVQGSSSVYVNDTSAPSAARIVYNHFGGATRFPNISADMMQAVDRIDSADLSIDDVLNPGGYVLLGFIMDSRTGLGRFREFRISNYQLMMELIDLLRAHSVDEILKNPDVIERVDLYNEQAPLFEQQIKTCAQIDGNLIVIDNRGVEPIYAGNRFKLYAMFPDCNISAHVMTGFKGQNTVIAIGKSIINRSSNTDVGALCLSYGGGGHKAAGTCQVDNEKADEILKEIAAKIKSDG